MVHRSILYLRSQLHNYLDYCFVLLSTATHRCRHLSFSFQKYSSSFMLLFIESEGKRGALCKGEFLERSKQHIRSGLTSVTYQAEEIVSLLGGAEFDRTIPRRTKAGCEFRYFTKDDVVSCLDNFRFHRLRKWSRIFNASLKNVKNRPLHIAFLGDSRVRQHFFSLYQVNRKADPTILMPFNGFSVLNAASS